MEWSVEVKLQIWSDSLWIFGVYVLKCTPVCCFNYGIKAGMEGEWKILDYGFTDR